MSRINRANSRGADNLLQRHYGVQCVRHPILSRALGSTCRLQREDRWWVGAALGSAGLISFNFAWK